jgi:hypothetical protein
MLSPLPRRSVWAYCFAHFAQPCQPSPIWRSGRPAHRPFRGLLGVHSRYGLHTRAVTVFRDTLSEGFSHFVTSIAAPAASGWSVRRVGLAPTGKRRLFTAHATSGLMHCSKLGRDSRGETQLTYASASTTGSIELVANRRQKCISLQILDQSLVARSPWPLAFTTSPESPVNCPKEAERTLSAIRGRR